MQMTVVTNIPLLESTLTFIFVYMSIFFFLVLPFLSLVGTFFLVQYNINTKILVLFNVFTMFFLFIISLILFFTFSFFDVKFFFYVTLGEWMTIGDLKLQWNFCFDYITIIMLFVVTTVSFLVHLYSLEYMSGDPNHLKFMQYLTLFTLSMYILVTGNNFIQLFIGWEGVGICSFLLINFWDTRILANTSAMKAIIVNRVGDFGLMFSFILLYNQFGSFDYGFIFSFINIVSSEFYANLMDWIVFFLFVGAVGKSAQVFLHVWLPDAMEG